MVRLRTSEIRARLQLKMKIQSVSLAWSRIAVLIWSSLWMLAAPLFHVHPEADHRHGEEGHLHGGTVHMAWSPDLDCESDHDRQGDPPERMSHEDFRNGAQFSHVGDRHPEFSLSLLSDATDRKTLKLFWAPVFGSTPAESSGAERCARIQRIAGADLSLMPFVRAISSRAPPSFLI